MEDLWLLSRNELGLAIVGVDLIIVIGLVCFGETLADSIRGMCGSSGAVGSFGSVSDGVFGAVG